MLFKHITKLGTAILLAVLVFSCGKETQSSTQGGGNLKVKISVYPPLQIGKDSTSLNTNFNQFGATVDYQTYMWNGLNDKSSFISWESQEFAVTKGQNFLVSTLVYNNYDFVCRSVKIEAYLNNVIFKVINLELGFDGNNNTKCKDQPNIGSGNSINLIIP